MSFLVGILFAATVFGQDTNRLVSAEVRAAAAPAAIAELAKQIGAPLEAAPSMKDDVLVVRVEKAPLKSLMERIASTLNAEWEQNGGGYRLIRTDRLRNAELAAEQERLAQYIKTSLDGYRKRILEEGDFTQTKAESIAERLLAAQERERAGATNAYAERQNLQATAPANRMMRSIVSCLDPYLLASIPRGKRIVYSDRPTRMQRQIPGEISRLIDRFVAEQNTWSQAADTILQSKASPGAYLSGNHQALGDRKVGKVLLIFQRNMAQEVVSVHLSIFDTKGSPITDCYDNVGWSWPTRLQETQQANQLAASEQPLQFTGLSKEFRDGLLRTYSGGRQPGEPLYQFTPAVKEFFLNTDRNEPLSLLATDTLFEVAKARHLNLVACLPDRMLLDITLARTKEVKPAMVLANATRHACEVQISDGWMVWKPRESSWARYLRADRAQAANYLRSVLKRGRETLDDKAAFAFRTGKGKESGIHESILYFLALAESREDPWDWDTLRLYGSLTPTQRRLLQSKQTLIYRSLQPAQKEIVREMLFDSEYYDTQIDIDDPGSNVSADEAYVWEVTLQYEPTELMPNGFTGNEILSLDETLAEIAYARPSPKDPAAARWQNRVMSDRDIAIDIFTWERPDILPESGEEGPRTKLAEFCLAGMRTAVLKVQLTQQASFKKELKEYSLPTTGWVPLDKLPSGFKKRVDEALAHVREMFKNSKPPPVGAPTRAIPPPPPSSSSRR